MNINHAIQGIRINTFFFQQVSGIIGLQRSETEEIFFILSNNQIDFTVAEITNAIKQHNAMHG